MRDLWTAFALVLVIEGAAWALFPEKMREMALKVRELSPTVLRSGGLIAAALGVTLVWLIRA